MLDNPLFRDLTREQYELLFPLFEPFTVQPRTVIFKQGDEAAYLYVISHGRVKITYKPYDGPKITLTHLGAGDIFGWSSVVGGDTYTSDAVTSAQVDGYRVRGAELMRLCIKFPRVGSGVLEKLAASVSPRWTNARKQIQDLLQPALPSDS